MGDKEVFFFIHIDIYIFQRMLLSLRVLTGGYLIKYRLKVRVGGSGASFV